MPHERDPLSHNDAGSNPGRGRRPSTGLLIGLGFGLWIVAALGAYLLARALL